MNNYSNNHVKDISYNSMTKPDEPLPLSKSLPINQTFKNNLK